MDPRKILLGTNISPTYKDTFVKLIFRFPTGGICDRSVEDFLTQKNERMEPEKKSPNLFIQENHPETETPNLHFLGTVFLVGVVSSTPFQISLFFMAVFNGV